MSKSVTLAAFHLRENSETMLSIKYAMVESKTLLFFLFLFFFLRENRPAFHVKPASAYSVQVVQF